MYMHSRSRQRISRLPMMIGSVVMLSSAIFSLSQTRPALSDAQVQSSVLSSLASAPELASQLINVSTTAGVVSLSGSVQNHSQRLHADQIASTTVGVQRVVDQLTIAGQSASVNVSAIDHGILQSDGTYAPREQGGQEQPSQENSSQVSTSEVPPPNGPDTDPYGRPLNGQQQSPEQMHRYLDSQQAAQHPMDGAYQQPGYGQPYANQQPLYSQPYAQPAGQPGGQAVTIPAGTIIRMRVNQHLTSRDVNVGTLFDGTVVNDIVSSGQVAIPRGAFVQGIVVDVASSGHLAGRGELGLKLTKVTLGGQNYPIVSDVFSSHGGDKTIQTVNSTVGLGALGAIFGAVAGGGAGAAIGAGVGGAAGLGASAASGRGDVYIPSEAVLSFHLLQPASVTTVSQAEMQRLAYGVPAGDGHVRRVIGRYPCPNYGPAVYPRYYGPHGYYRY